MIDLKTVQGATRPAVTVLFSLAMVGGFLMGRVSADQFVPVAVMVVGWWFAARSGGQK